MIKMQWKSHKPCMEYLKKLLVLGDGMITSITYAEADSNRQIFNHLTNYKCGDVRLSAPEHTYALPTLTFYFNPRNTYNFD